MIKNLKKAFTIIELVIVIAVIAVLAAVMIPTYSSLVEKANQSADIQAVKQMNTVLSTYVDGSIKNIGDAIEALDKDGIDFQNYTPLQKNHYFYFYMDGNTPKVVYTDAKDKAIYPEKANIDGVQLMSLSGEIEKDDTWKNTISNSTVSINSGAQFADFLNKYVEKSSDTQSITTIELTSNIDMKGSNASFGTVTNDITLTSEGSTAYTISGMQLDQHSVLGEWDGEDKDYGQALFNEVSNGANVTVSNVNFNNVVVRNDSGIQYGHSAVIFGKVSGTVTVDSVTISNCDVYGCDKAGAVIGYLEQKAEANLKDVLIKDTDIYGASFVAKLIGFVSRSYYYPSKNAKVIISDVNAGTNVNTFVNENTWSLLYTSDDKNFVTMSQVDITDVKSYLESNSTNTYLPIIKDNQGYLCGITTNDDYWLSGWRGCNFEIGGKTYMYAEEFPTSTSSYNNYANASQSSSGNFSN